MSESQAFFLLSVLCDRLLPGYYATTMYGTLLDQRVFESLVEKTMPVLWDHLVKSEVQLSVVSLPWFLSLFINSMPLVFAFRVLDVFFLEGPKVLFQVGLAILRINGEELLDATDDGAFISILKTYFSRLDESAHPKSENEKLRAVTRFQELMVVAFREFAGITQNTITEQRAKYKDGVLENIESFAKRTSIRNLGPDSKRLSAENLSLLYDRFYGVLYERQRQAQKVQYESERQAKAKNQKAKAVELLTEHPIEESLAEARVAMGPSPTIMDYDGFREFLARIAIWASKGSASPSQSKATLNNHHQNSYSHGAKARSETLSRDIDAADHDFMLRLFRRWDTDSRSGLSLQNIVSGLAQITETRDIMSSITYFFELYDDDHDGRVDREGILHISEALLFLSRRGLEGLATQATAGQGPPETKSPIGDLPADAQRPVDEIFLGSVSSFIRRCFEYADPDDSIKYSTNKEAAEDEASVDSGAFSIGDDEDQEDLLDFSITTGTQDSPTISHSQPSPPNASSTKPASIPEIPPSTAQRKSSRFGAESANLALDPANPLHITLPTFRMVILADELLEQFFEIFFPGSFRLSESPVPFAETSPTSRLTTFASLSPNRSNPSGTVHGPDRTATVPPARGLRGVLDNIVTDGMRVAAEVKRRMDEAQREMERHALTRDDDDEEEDGGALGGYGGEADRRSVREVDRELLEGAEADVESIREKDAEESTEAGKGSEAEGQDNRAGEGRQRSASSATQEIIEFDRS